MKKMFFLVLILVLAGTFLCSGQKTSNKETFTVQGFDGDKPLLEEQLVVVSCSENKKDQWFEPAYAGETKKVFIKRMIETYRPTYQKLSSEEDIKKDIVSSEKKKPDHHFSSDSKTKNNNIGQGTAKILFLVFTVVAYLAIAAMVLSLLFHKRLINITRKW